MTGMAKGGRSKAQKGLFPKVLVTDLEQLPIVKMSNDDKLQLSRCKKVIDLSETMTKLNEKLRASKTNHDKTLFQRQIEATDHQIDKLVYELYGLTEDEIKIVEGTA